MFTARHITGHFGDGPLQDTGFRHPGTYPKNPVGFLGAHPPKKTHPKKTHTSTLT